MKARHEFKTEKEYQDYLRTYFAAMAMQGLLASNSEGTPWGIVDTEWFAQQSAKSADALINALNQQP